MSAVLGWAWIVFMLASYLAVAVWVLMEKRTVTKGIVDSKRKRG